MDDDFQQHENEKLTKRREVQRDNYHLALSDLDVGKRIGNAGLIKANKDRAIQKKQDKKALDQALKINAYYAKLYNNVITKLNDATSIVYDALLEAQQLLAQAAEKLEAAQDTLADILEGASSLTDGTKVFFDEDGAAYTEDGRKLSEEEIGDVKVSENPHSWQDYLKAKEAKDAAKEQHDHAKERHDQLTKDNDRLGQIRERMEDDTIEKTPEELKDYEKEIDDIVDRASPASGNLEAGYKSDNPVSNVDNDMDFNF